MADNGEPGRALLVDAVLSEADVNSNLRSMLHSGLAHLKNETLLAWEPVMTAAVEACAALGCLSAHGVNIGQKSVSLTFHPSVSTTAKVLGSCEEPLRLLLSHFFAKVVSTIEASSSTFPVKIDNVGQQVELIYRICELVNTLFFLIEGRYPTLLLRLLKARQTPASSEALHLEDYASVGREALWHTFREVLSVLMPFGQVLKTYLLAHVVRRYRMRRKRVYDAKSDVKFVKRVSANFDNCALCDNPPILPVCDPDSNCWHSFCYACFKSEPLFNGSFVCPSCGTSLRPECAVFSSTGLAAS